MRTFYLLVILVLIYLLVKPSGYVAASPNTLFSRLQLNNLLKRLSTSGPVYDCVKNAYGALSLNTALVGTGSPINNTTFMNQYVNLIPTSNAKQYDANFRSCLLMKGLVK